MLGYFHIFSNWFGHMVALAAVGLLPLKQGNSSIVAATSPCISLLLSSKHSTHYALTSFQVSKLFAVLLGFARLNPFKFINLESHSGESCPLSFHSRHTPACLGKLCQFRHDVKRYTLYAFYKQLFLTRCNVQSLSNVIEHLRS